MAEKTKPVKTCKKKESKKAKFNKNYADMNSLLQFAEDDFLNVPKDARKDWLRNHQYIVAAYVSIVDERGVIPSSVAISRKLQANGIKLSVNAVSSHLNDFDFSKWRKRLRVACEVVAGRFARRVMRPNPNGLDVKTFFEISGEFKNVHEVEGRVDFRKLKERLSNGNDTPDDAAKRARDLANVLASY